MTIDPVPPSWRLPRGVNASLWRYAHSPRLAAEEDDYFAGHPLFEADRRAVDERFVEPGPLVDLGCGVGRHALRFAARGFPVAAVELSGPMLRVVGEKAARAGVDLLRVRANLCDLGCFPDATFAYALSLFSTLGMIRGREARRRALGEALRVLRPGGRLALHAHNVWLNLRDPQGRLWLLGQLGRALLHQDDLGDRRMTYRGIPDMEVHLYRWGELRSDIRAAGFRIDEVLPIDAVQSRPIAAPWLVHRLRAGGWIVFASRPGPR
jgi:SAM-dependent methyltransferase